MWDTECVGLYATDAATMKKGCTLWKQDKGLETAGKDNERICGKSRNRADNSNGSDLRIGFQGTRFRHGLIRPSYYQMIRDESGGPYPADYTELI